MKTINLLFALLISFTTSIMANDDTTLSDQEAQYIAQSKKVWESLHPKQGKIKLPNGVTTLNVPEDFIYLDADDAETVLVKIWNNPPNGARTLGMLFPKDAKPYSDDTWGVTIEYEEDGYVSDENANEIDYDDMLVDMQEDTESMNEMRVEQGYEPIHLVGWASAPYYDQATHKLHWAQELKFGDQEMNTLNYNIRVLGRKGVLVLNFIAGMNQLGLINEKIDTVLNMSEFDTGSKYTDFDPDMDKVAAYGIGALIAGKVAAKLGLLATLLIFLKKFWILALLGVGGFFKRIFGGKES